MYKLSIIIPIYNAEKYLERCLQSIIMKTDDIEYILIDDGSKDDSNLIYNKYRNISNVVIIKNENHGVSYARNYGINIASGRYIMFVDADDYLKEGWYNIVKEEIKQEQDIIIFSKYCNNEDYSKIDLQNACIQYGKNVLSNCSIMSPCSRVYKKKFLIKNNIKFEEEIINGEDMLFNFKAVSLTKNIKIVDKGIYIYRINFDSATNNFNENIFKSDIYFHIKLKELVSNDENSDKLQNGLYYLIINGIYIIATRLSYSKEKNKDKIIKELLSNDVYKNALSYYKKIKNNFRFFEKIILNLIFSNKIKFAITILNLKNRIKRKKILKKNIIKLKEL